MMMNWISRILVKNSLSIIKKLIKINSGNLKIKVVWSLKMTLA